MADNGGAYDGQRYFYVVGGYHSPDGRITDDTTGVSYVTLSNRLHRYDVLTNTWEVLPPAPKVMRGTHTVYARNALYVLPASVVDGHITLRSREFLKYDLATSTWSSLPNIPGDHVEAGGMAYDGNNTIYAGAFSNGFFSSMQVEHTYKFDIPSATWTEISPPPQRTANGIFVSDAVGRLYKIGGSNSGGDTSVLPSSHRFNNVQRYDPQTNSWQQLAPAPVGMMFGTGVFDNNGHFYITAGNDANISDASSLFFKYTIETNSWERLLDTPMPMNKNTAVWDGSGVLVTGGFSFLMMNTLYRYDPSVNVPNEPPDIGSITASVNPIQVNTATTVSSSFTDPAGTLDAPYSVVWNWGDGTVETETVSAPGALSKAHSYTAAGVYEVILTVTDKDGGRGEQSFQYLSVYSPTAQGLFSGGQKYTSPFGAYSQDPTATGTVKFGLSYKYQGDMPAGNRQFTMDFQTANFEFNATTVSSLVIADGIGTLRGTGTIAGRQGSFDFLVVGNETTDSIRIQIKDQSGTVIYDTQPGAADTASPTTTVTAGNVLAH